MHSISIAIPAEAADRLRELARRERRSPRQQAAVLVLAALSATAPSRSTPAGARRRPAAPLQPERRAEAKP